MQWAGRALGGEWEKICVCRLESVDRGQPAQGRVKTRTLKTAGMRHAIKHLPHPAEIHQRKTDIFVSRFAYKFQEEARCIPPWMTLMKVCPAIA